MVDITGGYLDASATAPLRREALAAMNRVWAHGQANASSVHSAGHLAKSELDRARSIVAHAFGIHEDAVVFTSGGTEANNLGIIGQALATSRGKHLVTTRIEHSSVLESCRFLHRVHGFDISYIDVDHHGRLIEASLEKVIRPDTTLIAVGLANSEVGTVQDCSMLADVASAQHLPLHIDAVQAAPALPINLTEGGWPGSAVSSMAIASHKFGGPQGMGALLLPQDLPLEPIIHGGNHEGGRRAGTENVAGAAGFAAAVHAATESIGSNALSLIRSRDSLINAILAAIPSAELTGHPSERLPGHASFIFNGLSGESLLVALDTAGFAVSTGSACKAGSAEASPVLIAMGYTNDQAKSGLRFSLPAPLGERTQKRIVDILKEETERRTKG